MNPAASSQTLLKGELVKLQASVSKLEKQAASNKRAVDERIAQLEQRLDETNAELERTKKDMRDLESVAHCLDVELDEQLATILTLTTRRARGTFANADSGTEADDEEEIEKLTKAKQKRADAARSPLMKNVIDESFRRIMGNLKSLRASHLPPFEEFAPDAAENPVRFKWDRPAHEVHNKQELKKVVSYVLEHGAIVTPKALPLLKTLTHEDVHDLVFNKFGPLAKSMNDYTAVAELSKKRDMQLLQLSRAPERDSDDESSENDEHSRGRADAMRLDPQADGTEDEKAVKILQKKEKALLRACIQRRKQATQKQRIALRKRLPDGDEYLNSKYNDAFIEQVQSAWEKDPFAPEKMVAYDKNFESVLFKQVKRLELRDDLKPPPVGTRKQPAADAIVKPRRIPQKKGDSSSDDIPRITKPENRVALWMVDPAWLENHPGALKRMRKEDSQ